MFRKVLIANRGEIAVRIARTCRELGVGVVALFSDADTGSRHVALADEAVHLPGVAPSETYLNVAAIIRAAVDTRAEAVHPGYGFLSERADVADQVADAGVAWIGPPADAARAAGDKIRARRLAESVGVAPVPGTFDPVPTRVRSFASAMTTGIRWSSRPQGVAGAGVSRSPEMRARSKLRSSPPAGRRRHISDRETCTWSGISSGRSTSRSRFWLRSPDRPCGSGRESAPSNAGTRSSARRRPHPDSPIGSRRWGRRSEEHT